MGLVCELRWLSFSELGRPSPRRAVDLKSRGGGTDNKLYIRDPDKQRWEADDETTPLSIHVGNGVLPSSRRGLTYSGDSMLEVQAKGEAIGEPYYANGFLVLQRYKPAAVPYDPSFTFLADGKWKEYGIAYRYRRPGSLAVHTQWKNGPTIFRFRCSEEHMSVSQDGVVQGATSLPEKRTALSAPRKIQWGAGIFGPPRGKILHRRVGRSRRVNIGER